MHTEVLTIGEIAHQAGLRPSTLRYYESIGLLPAQPRVNGRRQYTPDILQLLAVIRLARQAGFSVAEVRTLLHGFPSNTSPAERWQGLASHKLAEVSQLIANAQRMQDLLKTLLQCDCSQLEDCAADDDAPCGQNFAGAATPIRRNLVATP